MKDECWVGIASNEGVVAIDGEWGNGGKVWSLEGRSFPYGELRGARYKVFELVPL